jgi:hypothetical protein
MLWDWCDDEAANWYNDDVRAARASQPTETTVLAVRLTLALLPTDILRCLLWDRHLRCYELTPELLLTSDRRLLLLLLLQTNVVAANWHNGACCETDTCDAANLHHALLAVRPTPALLRTGAWATVDIR